MHALATYLRQLANRIDPPKQTQWLRIGRYGNGMDFDVHEALPYRDIQKLDWNKQDGFTEVGDGGTAIEQYIPLHATPPQVHTIYRITGDKTKQEKDRLYRLGYSMPVLEGSITAVHVNYGAYWVERIW